MRLASLIERKDDNKSDVEYIVRASANEVKALLVFPSNRRDEVTDEKCAELTISAQISSGVFTSPSTWQAISR